MDEVRLVSFRGGVFSRAEALRAGVSSATVARRVAEKEWRAVFPGVYRHSAVTVSDLVMVEAAMLWAGPAAVLSGSWAAWWHGLRAQPFGPVSVTMPRGSAARARPDVTVRRRTLLPCDVTVLRGVRVVSRALAALENARHADGQDVVDRALQHHVSIPELADTMSRFTGAHGSRSARRSLALVSDGTVSPAERSLAAAFRRAGLTSITAGVRVRVGGRQFWLDFAVEAVRLAIEVDGVSAHSDPTAFHRDRERQNLLVRAGWTVLRYTPRQLQRDMPGVIAEIRATLDDLGG